MFVVMDLTAYFDNSAPGERSRMARALGVSPVLISQWGNEIRRVPAERVLDISIFTRGAVRPYDLRPDLYPDAEWLPPEVADHSEAVGQ